MQPSEQQQQSVEQQQVAQDDEPLDEHVGLITYIRTDSTYLSDTFVERAKNYITETYGKEYVGKREKDGRRT